MVNAMALLQLVTALTPFVVDGVVTVGHVISTLVGVGALSADEVDADLRKLIEEAIEAKAMADRAASGNDPR